MPLYFSEEKDYNFTYDSSTNTSESDESVEGLRGYIDGDKIYVFYFDGKRYELKYETYSTSNGEISCFGNPYLVGKHWLNSYLPNNGIPFGCGGTYDRFYVSGNQKTHRIAYYSLETEG